MPLPLFAPSFRFLTPTLTLTRACAHFHGTAMIMLTDDADRNLTTRRSHLCAHQGRTTHTHSGLPPPSRRPSGVAKRAVALVFFMQRRLPSTSPSSFLPRPPKNPTPVAYRCEQQIPKNRPLFVLLPKFKSPPPPPSCPLFLDLPALGAFRFSKPNIPHHHHPIIIVINNPSPSSFVNLGPP